MANITYTITQDGEEISYTINDGVGPVGPAGPNNITTATSTDITGILKGDGANVSAAVENTDYQGVPAEGAFIDGDKTKLDGIEAGADVTDATNVDAAGAVMESDYSPSHSVLAQQSGTGSPSSVTLGTDSLLGRSSGAGTAIQGLTAAQARTLLNVEDGATADQTAAEIKTAYESNANTNAFTDAEQSKLAVIEAGATADQTGAEIKALYEAEANTNAFTDAEKSKLAGVEAGATADQTAAEILTAIKTVDGAGSGLDADLLDGQDSSAFATSAQGALADSAVQPGDIDTLAELNAIITDATLIDTTDSRLSDARTPTAHTHTASDLDFAGSTDIGADLADADEVLVSDGGGNTTRVKSALSRFWTYIKAKIDAGLTIAGNQSFSGQVELTGQGIDSANSALNASLGYTLPVFLRTGDTWSKVNGGRIEDIPLSTSWASGFWAAQLGPMLLQSSPAYAASAGINFNASSANGLTIISTNTGSANTGGFSVSSTRGAQAPANTYPFSEGIEKIVEVARIRIPTAANRAGRVYAISGTETRSGTYNFVAGNAWLRINGSSNSLECLVCTTAPGTFAAAQTTTGSTAAPLTGTFTAYTFNDSDRTLLIRNTREGTTQTVEIAVDSSTPSWQTVLSCTINNPTGGQANMWNLGAQMAFFVQPDGSATGAAAGTANGLDIFEWWTAVEY